MSAKTSVPLSSLWSGPGTEDLERYSRLGGGDALLRAYVKRREADRDEIYLRCVKQIEFLQKEPATSVEREATLKSLMMEFILAKLDPVIQDLLKFCEAPGPKDKQLEALRRALRINRGQSPADIRSARRRERALHRWSVAYREMARTSVLRSDRSIAREIAKKLRITPRAAWGYKRKDAATEFLGNFVREYVQLAAADPGSAKLLWCDTIDPSEILIVQSL